VTVEVYERRGLGAALRSAGQFVLLGALIAAWPAALAIGVKTLLGI